jgi:hypothetical protein
VPEDVARILIWFATSAAGHEALRPRPDSLVTGPRGEVQPETPHEFVSRVVTAGVLHLTEIGLLVVPRNFEARCNDILPKDRDDMTWQEPARSAPS